MHIIINYKSRAAEVDLGSGGFDLSLAMHPRSDAPRAWYVDPLVIEAVRGDGFIGSVKEGGSVNFRTIQFNPHAHGTHTENVGHIDREVGNVNEHLHKHHFFARLISVSPESRSVGKEADGVITWQAVSAQIGNGVEEVLMVRTEPNDSGKLSRNYSNTNPPYFEPAVLHNLRKMGVRHLMTDLPSVDRERDGGRLLAHRAWFYEEDKALPGQLITEMCWFPNECTDGVYLLNLHTVPFENDAVPCRPVIYPISMLE